MQRNSQPIPWRPRGCSDAIYANEVQPGAMASLSNLIHDPSSKGIYQCRPAAIRLTSFGTFASPQFISICQVIGQYVYGMIATARNPGYDEPFVFDLLANAFVTVSGIMPTNVPASPSVSGAWVPPTMDTIGSKVCVTHPGFSGAFGAFFGYFDIGIPTAPVWNPGNCVGVFPGFTVAPSAVRQFNGRAYFIHNLTGAPAVIFSDVNNPLTNGASALVPILTFGDSLFLTALGGLPLENQLGGIIQSLMVFKDANNIYQITGDVTTSNLTINTLNVPTGTSAPSSVVATPVGLAFMSPDGLRIIDWDARVSPPIGQDGEGVAIPFIFANVPSRMSATSNGEIYRISTQNAAAGNVFQEWWYDFARKSWTGPHTCAMSDITPFGKTFIGALQGVNAALWQSDYLQSVVSTYIENSVQLTWQYTTVLFPDADKMTNNNMIMTTLDVALSSGIGAIHCNAVTQNGTLLATADIPAVGGAPLWGSVNWGQFNWGGTSQALASRQIPWPIPIDFTRLAINVNSTSASGFKIGCLHLRWKPLRFLVDVTAVVA